jgi:hypothetical protein
LQSVAGLPRQPATITGKKTSQSASFMLVRRLGRLEGS